MVEMTDLKPADLARKLFEIADMLTDDPAHHAEALRRYKALTCPDPWPEPTDLISPDEILDTIKADVESLTRPDPWLPMQALRKIWEIAGSKPVQMTNEERLLNIIAIARGELFERPSSDARCNDCGRSSGDENGMLCPSCICRRAHAAGLTGVEGTFRSGPFAHSEPSGWRPIAEAPKDGTRILAVSETGYHYLTYWGRVSDDFPIEWVGTTRHRRPVAWQELPLPPTKQEAE